MSVSAASPELPGVTQRWVTANGIRLHIAEAGTEHDGPALVLVHGWPQHWWCWHRVIPLLAERHRVIAVDLRGHGWSEVPTPGGDAYDKRTFADDISALIDALALDRPVVIGHDWGAWTALLVAGRSPEKVRGVVATAIIAPWSQIKVRDLWRFAYQFVVGGPWGVLAHRAFGQAFLKLLFRLGSHRKRAWSDAETEPYLERYRDRSRAAAGRSVYGQFLRAEFPDLLRRRYQKPVTDVPILLLPGKGDLVLAPDLVGRALGPANIAMETIAGAGHWVPEEQPEVLAEHILGFVESLER